MKFIFNFIFLKNDATGAEIENLKKPQYLFKVYLLLDGFGSFSFPGRGSIKRKWS
jgi:hypothetical protein